MNTEIIYVPIHPETYYATWNKLHAREQHLRREMNAIAATERGSARSIAASNAWERASQRVTEHERTF